MSRLLSALILILPACGCAQLQNAWAKLGVAEVAAPAAPAPPPRLAGVGVAGDGSFADGPSGGDSFADGGGFADDPYSGVRTASASDDPPTGPSAPVLDDTTVVATVNGEPVLAGDILQMFAAPLRDYEAKLADGEAKLAAATNISAADRRQAEQYLAAARRRLPAERAELVRSRLPERVDRVLLVQKLKQTMDKEEADQIDSVANTLFEREVLPGLLEKNGVRNKRQLEKVLQSQGMSLQVLVAEWIPNQLAQLYLQQESGAEAVRVGRREIVEYYDTHLPEFTPPRQAKWRQILIPYASADERAAAFEVLQIAVEDLKRDRPFAEVAGQYSRGPKAKDGGLWDWTRPDNLADEQVDAALFSLPVGKISPVIEWENGTGGAFKLVVVEERTGDAPQPLAEVQQAIQAKLTNEGRAARIEAVKERVRAEADLEYRLPGVEG